MSIITEDGDENKMVVKLETMKKMIRRENEVTKCLWPYSGRGPKRNSLLHTHSIVNIHPYRSRNLEPVTILPLHLCRD